MSECRVYGLIDLKDPYTIRYVGCTIQKLERRLEQHRRYPSPKILEWVNSIGYKRVEIVTLEVCDESVRGEREQFYMDQYENLLNTFPGRQNYRRGY